MCKLMSGALVQQTCRRYSLIVYCKENPKQICQALKASTITAVKQEPTSGAPCTFLQACCISQSDALQKSFHLWQLRIRKEQGQTKNIFS